jgi:hypothetical protein
VDPSADTHGTIAGLLAALTALTWALARLIGHRRRARRARRARLEAGGR